MDYNIPTTETEWAEFVRSLHRGDGADPLTPEEIAELLGMDGEDGAWNLGDVYRALGYLTQAP